MRKICFSLPMFFVILLLFAACSGKQEKILPENKVSSISSDSVSSIIEESSSIADYVSSQETNEITSSQENIFAATPPLEEEDFALYNDSGEKVWWLKQKFTARENSDTQSLRPKAIPGTEYIGRRELRRIMPDDIYFYDVYKFENDVATIFAFNYVGNALRDMDNYYIHAVTTLTASLITNRGIRVGDSRKKILDTYGFNRDFKSEYMTFKDVESGFEVYFTLENDVVVKVGISYFPDELQYVEYPDTYQ